MGKPAESLIEAVQLCVHEGAATLLNNVDIAVRPHEIVTLIGPNGSGKTTLVKALLGLRPYSGIVKRAPNLAVGYVPQQFARDRSLPLTVERFMSLFSPREVAEKALARVGLDSSDFTKQVSLLSGGEMARVLLARAIAKKPQLLVLDEPLAGVDVAGEAALYHLIADIRNELGCGVLLVSHDLHVVMAAADRVICLNGHVCCEGRAAAVVDDPAFVNLFGARMAQDLALYVHHHDHRHTLAGEPLGGSDGHSHEHRHG